MEGSLLNRDRLNRALLAVVQDFEPNTWERGREIEQQSEYYLKMNKEISPDLKQSLEDLKKNAYKSESFLLNFDDALKEIFTVFEYFGFGNETGERLDSLSKELEIGNTIDLNGSENLAKYAGISEEILLENEVESPLNSILVFKFNQFYIVTPVFQKTMWLWEGLHAKKLQSVLEKGMIQNSEDYIRGLREYIDLYPAYVGGFSYTGKTGKEIDVIEEIFLLVDICIENAGSYEMKKDLIVNKAILSYFYADKGEADFTEDGHTNYNQTVKWVYDCFADEFCKTFLNQSDILSLFMIRFLIAVKNRNDKLVLEIGEYLWRNRKNFYHIAKDKPYICNPFSFSRNDLYMFRKFPNHSADWIFYQLFRVYTEKNRFDDAYRLLKEDPLYFSRFFKQYESVKNDEGKLNKFFGQLERNIRSDISLIVSDSYVYEEMSIKEWKERIKGLQISDVNYRFYKGISEFFLRLIMVFFANGEYRLTKEFLRIYNQYLIIDEDYLGMSSFIENAMEQMDAGKVIAEIREYIEEGIKEIRDIKTGIRVLLPSHSANLAVYTNQIEERLKSADRKISRTEAIFDSFMAYMLELRKKYGEYSRRLQNSDEESEQWIPVNEILNKGLENIGHFLENQPSEIDISLIEHSLEEKFGRVSWRKLHPESRRSIITGNAVYKFLSGREDADQLDFATACIAWCRAVEKELSANVYMPLLDKYKIDPCNKLYRFTSFTNKTRERNGKISWPKKESFTMGSFSYFTGYKKGSIFNQEDHERFKSFAKNYLFIQTSDRSLEKLIQELTMGIVDLTYNYRNPSAHPNRIDIRTARGCYDMICITEKLLIKLAENYNPDWCKVRYIP